MLAAHDRKRLSKFFSRVLRHAPEAAGITLDAEGWADLDDVLAAAARQLGLQPERADVEALVAPDPDPRKKIRFQLDGERIRAGHGHSRPVGGHREVRPDRDLLHATRRAVLEPIRRDGLRSMGRQMVHLSHDPEMMVEAARRQGGDVILVHVDVARALADGVVFYQGADARVFLAEAIGPQYLRFSEVDGGELAPESR